MSTDNLRFPDAAVAESLLDGGCDGPPELVALLARASAPAHPVELAGEAAALAAFRAAAAAPAPRAARRVVTRLVTAKAAVLAALAIGGVAIAATGVVLPMSGGGRPAVTPSSRPPGVTPTDAWQTSGAPRTTGSPASPTPTPGPAPAAALVGLCRAYHAVADNGRGKALRTPAFSALVAAAGGAARVPAFCARLDAEPTAGPSTKGKNGGGRSGGRPTPMRPAGPPEQR
jgi:hypothetical protein